LPAVNASAIERSSVRRILVCAAISIRRLVPSTRGLGPDGGSEVRGPGFGAELATFGGPGLAAGRGFEAAQSDDCVGGAGGGASSGSGVATGGSGLGSGASNGSGGAATSEAPCAVAKSLAALRAPAKQEITMSNDSTAASEHGLSMERLESSAAT